MGNNVGHLGRLRSRRYKGSLQKSNSGISRSQASVTTVHAQVLMLKGLRRRGEGGAYPSCQRVSLDKPKKMDEWMADYIALM